jgi:hypothetical protein
MLPTKSAEHQHQHSPPLSMTQASPQNNCSSSSTDMYWHYNPGPELYSRKVFVGGLPIDVDEGTTVLLHLVAVLDGRSCSED